MRILLVEDDEMIGEAICTALKDASYSPDWVRTISHAELSVETHQYTLLLLDLSLPDGNGMDFLNSIRKKGVDTPTIIITAKESVRDRISGLDCGADDYIPKPFDLEELLARIRAVIRRRQGLSESIIQVGSITLNLIAKTATVNSEQQVQLSSKEYSLLYNLMSRPGAILSKEELEQRIYSWQNEIESNAIEFHIHSLRKKLGKETIKNIRGLGWTIKR